MKKVLLGLSILCFSLSFANGTEEIIMNNNDSKIQFENDAISAGNWGCSGTLSVYDDWSGEYIVIKTYSICCYDTPEEACSAVEQELESVAELYR